tara:strand:- start:1017 stop:1979 length:963 start_codon:yes stop_codon:yes gene_type:complete
MKSKLLIITPVKHIQNFRNKINENFKPTYIPLATKKSLKKEIKKFDYIFTNPNMSKVFIDKSILEGSKIKAICTASTGTNHIDINYIKKKNIKLISLTKELKLIRKLSSTAELAFGLTLNSVRKIFLSSQSVKEGNWSYLPFVGRMMKNLKIFIIGYGRLGRIYTKYCLNFGAKVFVYDPNINIKNKRVIVVKKLKKNLKKFDVISLNIHATKKNINFLNKDIFKNLKNDVAIINTSRGEIINEKQLISFLKKNKNASYSADVISGEQKNYKDNILFKFFLKKTNQIFLTPHIGGMTSDGQKMAYNHALNLLIKFDKRNV